MKPLAIVVVVLAACSGSGGDAELDASSGADARLDPMCTNDELAAIEMQMAAALEQAGDDTSITREPAFTLLLEAGDGRRFSHARAGSTATTRYESASTSKWVTAVVILDLVDRGKLSLTTKAHDLLPFWVETSVDLRDLLSFTSGYSDTALCINLRKADFATCVETMYDENVASAAAPGAEYDYSSSHMQFAGLMAVNAAAVANWTTVFDAFKTRSGLFATSVYDLPSATNPRLAGGMTWTAEEYLAFLRALADESLLEPASRTALFANQRGTATVVSSPAFDAVSEDWSYGLGNWLECKTATALGTYDCGEGHRNSSPGAYGAYPFIDFDDDYFGIVARKGTLGSSGEGVAIFRSIEDLAHRWATRRCD